jgi:uncharacterized protein (DUF427 family)
VVDVAANGKQVESVWDFPRPPRVERVEWRIRIELAGVVVADAPWSHRVLETSQPPAYYLDPRFIDDTLLRADAHHHTLCEWKGIATYADVLAGDTIASRAAWSFPRPAPEFASIAGAWAFYPQLLDCWVDDEHVQPNQGSFYGGWVTVNVTGPFKGGPGTSHW